MHPEIFLRHFSHRIASGLAPGGINPQSSHARFEVGLQRNGLIVHRVLRTEDQRDSPVGGNLAKIVEGSTLRIEFREVAAFELHPTRRVVPKPFSQGCARRNNFEPLIDLRLRLGDTARPDAIHQHAEAVAA